MMNDILPVFWSVIWPVLMTCLSALGVWGLHKLTQLINAHLQSVRAKAVLDVLVASVQDTVTKFAKTAGSEVHTMPNAAVMKDLLTLAFSEAQVLGENVLGAAGWDTNQTAIALERLLMTELAKWSGQTIASPAQGVAMLSASNAKVAVAQSQGAVAAGKAAVLVLMSVALITVGSACAGFGTSIEGSVASCTVQDAETQAPGLILNAVTALMDPSPTAWQPEVTALEESAANMGVCVIQAAVARLEAASTAAAGASMVVAQAHYEVPSNYVLADNASTAVVVSGRTSTAVAVARGEAYLAAWHLRAGKLVHRRVQK